MRERCRSRATSETSRASTKRSRWSTASRVSMSSSQSTRARVESVLVSSLHAGEVKMDTVASKLGLSRPTLFRKLRAEGLTFEQVLDDLRHARALNCLTVDRASVKQTARLVGY